MNKQQQVWAGVYPLCVWYIECRAGISDFHAAIIALKVLPQ